MVRASHPALPHPAAGAPETQTKASRRLANREVEPLVSGSVSYGPDQADPEEPQSDLLALLISGGRGPGLLVHSSPPQMNRPSPETSHELAPPTSRPPPSPSLKQIQCRAVRQVLPLRNMASGCQLSESLY